MSPLNLQNLLQKLHLELHQTETDDETAQTVIDDLKTHVEKALDEPEHYQVLRERLEDSLTLFEVEHPTLTGAIQAVNLSLSSAGM